MKIIGINPSHHGSVCLLEDGELKFFIQEERVGNRLKHGAYPFKSFIELIQKNQIDKISMGSPSLIFNTSNITKFNYWALIAFSLGANDEYWDYSPKGHHVCHASSAFYNSGFKESLSIVIDGLGSNVEGFGQETETIFRCSYPNTFDVLYKKISKYSNEINLSQAYEDITMHLGWSCFEAGKTMGLAPYGKLNKNLPQFKQGNQINPNVFIPNSNKEINNLLEEKHALLNEEKYPQLKLKTHPKEWHYNQEKISDLEKDLAWKIQNDTQQMVGDYIEKYTKKTNLKNVCCSGGYFLNCVTNYYLLKRFPNLNFYFDPLANDSGTALGSAKLTWHTVTQDKTVRPLKSLYLGKQYSKEELLEGIKKYTNYES